MVHDILLVGAIGRVGVKTTLAGNPNLLLETLEEEMMGERIEFFYYEIAIDC